MPFTRRARQVLLCMLVLFVAAACRAAAEPPPATLTPGGFVAPAVTRLPTDPAVTATALPLPAVTLASPATSTLPPPPPPATPTEVPRVGATQPPTPAFQLIGPEAIPENVNPLTGETAPDPAALAHRPIAIKISNSSPVVRPQSGLSDAAIVFEHYAEGGITRFTAVFYGSSAPLVGPVRSARLIDLEIPKMYDAAFGYSGSSGPVREMMRDSSFFSRVVSPDFGHDGFWRDYEIGSPDKPSWETMYTSTGTLQRILESRSEDRRPSLPANLLFDATPPSGGETALTLELQYQATNVFWRYDAGANRYLRWSDGAPHLDANDGSQLAFRNVIVVAANHVETLILEDEVGDGHFGIEIQLWGEGPASLLRDGQRIEARWARFDPDHMVTFHDGSGNMVPLAPGNTFIQVVPLGFASLWTSP